MRRKPTVALVLQAILEMILAWGARWLLQICFWSGLGVGIGLGVSAWMVQRIVKHVCL